MVQLSEKLVLELQKIIKEEYGKDVTLKEAREIGEDLTGYYDILGRVYHKMKVEENKKE